MPDSVSHSEATDRNALSDLPSLRRMNRRDQTVLANRLRQLSFEAKTKGAITLAANLLRATYELEGSA